MSLINSKKRLTIQKEKEKQAAELVVVNKELAFQNKEKRKRAAELIVANRELVYQNEEKGKRAAELIVAKKELVFQTEEKGKRAAELIIANKEKRKRAAELVVANTELVFQTEEKEKRAAELVIADTELVYQSEEKEKRAAELIIANIELDFQNEEKEKRAAELMIANAARKKDEDYIGYLAAIVESSDDAIMSKSLDGIIKSWNKGGEKMFGYTSNEAVGNHISLIIPPEYIKEEKKIGERMRNNETIAHFETIRKNKNGEQFYVSLTVSPLKDRAGGIIGISVIARDITSRKKSEMELLYANKELIFQNGEKEKREAELIIVNKQMAFQNDENEKKATTLLVANAELAFQNLEKEKRAAELIIANHELAFQNVEKEKRAAELVIANNELAFQNEEKEKRAAELVIANNELAFQNDEKEKKETTLIIANAELAFQNVEKEKRAAELIIANKELEFQNIEKEKRAAELVIANNELAFQNEEKEKRAAELIVANHELAFQNDEKEKKATTLIIANAELAFQNREKEKRAAELIIANNELAFQNVEKEKRAAELVIANHELAFQNEEKEKRAAELIIANNELAFQNKEKEEKAAKLIVANKKLAFENEEKEKRAAELIVANEELAFQNEEKEKRAAELSLANNELKKAEEQFRLVVESAPNAMVLVNSEGLITLVNNQTEKLFGYDRNELVGNKLEILLPDQFRQHHPGRRHAFFKKPETRAMGAGRDLFARKKNGTEIQVEIGLSPIETGKGYMVLASIVDITERKIQEAAQKKLNKDLAQFAYVASHDLQEPLRTVSNYMSIFEEDYLPLLDDNARKYLHSVNSATKRMSMLVKSLLAFSRLGQNKKLALVDCKIVMDNVIADLDTMIKTSNTSIEVADLPQLNGYETELGQVFQNLIINAIKFQRKGSQPKIQIRSDKIDGKWRFSVSDNGIGIAPSHFERVFDIFQRLHTGEEYEGSGIGLANCKKIIQLHQGEIWIESTLGQGSTFYFTITL